MILPTQDINTRRKNALPTKFGNLSNVREVVKQKKLRRLMRKVGFRKRSGYKLDKLIEARLLATCVGAKPTLAASEAAKDPAIGCRASNSTLSRMYEYSDELKMRKFWWGLARGFRLGKGSIWAIDGTFIHVHGNGFELAEWGYDSNQDKLALGYLFVTVFDLANNRPVFWRLLPGNAPEKLLLQSLLEGAMQASGKRPRIVVMDRGFLTKENIRWLESEGMQWVSRALADMKVSDDNRSLTPEDWFTYYEMGKSRRVYWKEYGSLNLVKEEKVKDTKVVDTKYLIGSSNLTAERIIALYRMRWGIEEYHKQIRDLGLNVLPTGRFEGIRLHVALVLLAFILLHTIAKVIGLVGKSVVTIKRALCIAGFVGLGPP